MSRAAARRCAVFSLAGLLLGVGLPGSATAHVLSSRVQDSGEAWSVWVPLLLSAFLYASGLLRWRARSQRPGWKLRAGAFVAGLWLLWLALLSRLDTWSAELFACHMVQHELLMLAAAPLLVLGRPLPLFLWAMSNRWRGWLAATVRQPSVQGTWRTLVAPGSGWLLHAIALWVWHIPRFFNAALLNRTVHDMQHLSFLLAALVFWAALFEERRRGRQGAAIVYLFTTTLHTSVLGALLTFAARPWYSAYLQASSWWKVSALEDQQLGGLIMWVPCSLVYVGLALVLLARWIGHSGPEEAGVRPTPE